MTLNQIGSKVFTKMILEIQRFDLKIKQMVQELNQELDNIGVDQKLGRYKLLNIPANIESLY